MCCPLPSVAEYQKRFVSPRPNVTDTTALPTARIISSKGKSIVDLYSELGRRKAYGTAILAGDEDARSQLRAMDRHDEDEIMELLHEAEEEVIAEIEIDQAVDAEARGDDFYSLRQSITPFDNVPVTREGSSHPPIGVEASILNQISDEAKAKGARHGLGPFRVYDHGCVISTSHPSICGGVMPPCTRYSIRTRLTISYLFKNHGSTASGWLGATTREKEGMSLEEQLILAGSSPTPISTQTNEPKS
jgi:hypothetical protein